MAKLTTDQKKKLTILKRAGLTNIDLRKNTATKYQISKIRKFSDVIDGKASAVKLTKKQKSEFKKSGAFQLFGDNLIVRSTIPYERLSNRNGVIKAKSLLSNGMMTKIILPYSARNILELAEKIENDDDLPEYLTGQDGELAQYAFSIGGHQSLLPFSSKADLVKYIKGYYNHLFKQDLNLFNFSLVYFSGDESELPDMPENITGEKIYSPSGEGRKFAKPDATGRNSTKKKAKSAIQLEKNKQRFKQMRRNMTPEQRIEYNRKGRARALKSKRNKKD